MDIKYFADNNLVEDYNDTKTKIFNLYQYLKKKVTITSNTN